MAKMIAKIADFEIYKLPGKIAIYENDVFFVQLFRKGNARDFNDPVAYVNDVIANRVEAEADKVLARDFRKQQAAAYLAMRRDRAARQPQFDF